MYIYNKNINVHQLFVKINLGLFKSRQRFNLTVWELLLSKAISIKLRESENDGISNHLNINNSLQNHKPIINKIYLNLRRMK